MDDILEPQYDRTKLRTRIVHLGFGAFHRAHQALYTSELLDKTGADWGICEVSLFSSEPLIEQLRAQNHLYSVVEKKSDGNTVKICGAVNESLHPNLDGKAAVLNKMAEEQVSIVSLTITEKGYCADFSTGSLDLENTLIQRDFANPSEPNSAIAYIVEALRLRKEVGLPAFTVMSCDNIQGNGHVARQVVLDYAFHIDPDLGKWIDENVSFPCTMVDRIVPAVTESSLTDIAELLGVEDPCGVVCEPFRQWVIEDNFVNGRPDWDKVGATFTDDVVPFEEMKLRMINGSHSFLAYLGYLGGYQYIFETMVDENYHTAISLLMMEEQAVTLDLPERVNVKEYADSLVDRFSNPSIKHETYQIATDGSQKLPQRFCESLRFLYRSGFKCKVDHSRNSRVDCLHLREG